MTPCMPKNTQKWWKPLLVHNLYLLGFHGKSTKIFRQEILADLEEVCVSTLYGSQVRQHKYARIYSKICNTVIFYQP